MAATTETTLQAVLDATEAAAAHLQEVLQGKVNPNTTSGAQSTMQAKAAETVFDNAAELIAELRALRPATATNEL